MTMEPPPLPPPPQQQQEEEDPMSILARLEGLTEEEKHALYEEQVKIMADIERTQNASAADRFEQRSYSAAVSNVGGSRRLASTPASSSTTTRQSGNNDSLEAAQLQADMDLAEQLQKEEYKRAELMDRARSATSSRGTSSSPAAANTTTTRTTATTGTTSWMEWLGLSSSKPASTTSPTSSTARTTGGSTASLTGMSFAQPPRSSPPGSANRNQSSPRYDPNSTTDESTAQSSSTGAGRVAESQPLFSCVADSISVAANSLTTAYNASQQDDEGNVHGVDASSLLAMSSAGRGGTNNNGM